MSQTRHRPRNNPKIKLRLRLPTDGSVDLDKLRASLEARLENPPAPPQPAVDPLQPEVISPAEPQPVSQPQSSSAWEWISNNAPTTVCLFSAVLAFFVGLIYVGQRSAGEGNASPILLWFFVLSVCSFLIAFGFVVFRQLKREGTAAAHHWTQIKANPKKIYVPLLVFAAVLVLVFFTLTFLQSSSSEVAQGQGKTGTVTPAPSSGKQPDDSKELPPPPEIPPTNNAVTPLLPEVEVPPKKSSEPKTSKSDEKVIAKSFRPEEGFGGRLVGVFGVAAILGCGLFQLKRLRRKVYPDAEKFQAASKAEYFEFTRGFRTFVASQGAFVLVSAAVATPLTFFWTGGVFGDATFSGFLTSVFLGTGVSFLMVLGAGAAGLDLMPPLDNYLSPSSGGSATSRFIKRKVWQVVLGGVVLGGLGYAWMQEPLKDWVGLFLKRGLVWGQLVAVFWWSSNFWSSKLNKDIEVPVLPLKKPVKMLPTKWIPTPLFILFNLPLLIVLGCLLALMPVVFGASIKWLWFYFPLGVVVAIALCALVKRHPRLLRRWRELVFFPALAAMALGLFFGFGSGSFFIIFLLVMWMMAGGVIMADSKKTKEVMGDGILVLPEKRNDYRPVIHPDKNGVQIRWGSLVSVTLVVVLLLISSGSFLWSGKSDLENLFHEKGEKSVEVIREANANSQSIPTAPQSPLDFSNLSREVLKAEMSKIILSDQSSASYRTELINGWRIFAAEKSLTAQYNLALAYYDWSQTKVLPDSFNEQWKRNKLISERNNASKNARLCFENAGEQGHDLSCYNAGVLFFNQKSINEAMLWFSKIKDPEIIEKHSISDLIGLYKRRGEKTIDFLSEKGAGMFPLELDRSEEIKIQPSP